MQAAHADALGVELEGQPIRFLEHREAVYGGARVDEQLDRARLRIERRRPETRLGAKARKSHLSRPLHALPTAGSFARLSACLMIAAAPRITARCGNRSAAARRIATAGGKVAA